MKLKEKMKRFWTLNVHNHEGFTLVELIIVIAILAILSSVAVVGYSSYVTKANKQADRTLVADVVNALTLYYYANPDKVTDGYVVLTPEYVPCEFDDNGKAAMDAAFGAGWENALSLKYDGWKSTNVGADFSGSTFDGNLDKLMNTVNNLSGTLKDFLTNYDGGSGFNAFLGKSGINKSEDPNAAANAAVVYVSDMVTDANRDNITAILTDMPNQLVNQFNANGEYDSVAIIENATGLLLGEVKGSTLTAAAILYAYAESYAIATGQSIEIDPTKITSGTSGLNEVKKEFADLLDAEAVMNNPARLNGTLTWCGITFAGNKMVLGENAPYQKDVQAILSAMSAVDNISGSLMENIGKENLYASDDTKNLINLYISASAACEEGSVLIMISNGVVLVDPVDLVK